MGDFQLCALTLSLRPGVGGEFFMIGEMGKRGGGDGKTTFPCFSLPFSYANIDWANRGGSSGPEVPVEIGVSAAAFGRIAMGLELVRQSVFQFKANIDVPQILPPTSAIQLQSPHMRTT